MTRKMTASDLFAMSQGSANMGDLECHWCGSLCTREFVHNDVPPIPFTRSKSTAKRPNNAYQCVGCWLWQRLRVTVLFLTGEYKDKTGEKKGYLDGQTAKKHSWWITDKGAWALRSNDYGEIWKLLLCPPKKFALSLKLDNTDNLLQLTEGNDPGGIVAETPLKFTVGNISHSYTIYELTESIKHGPDHYGPGVRALWSYLGEPPDSLKQKHENGAEKKGRGRPRPNDGTQQTTQKVIAASGDAT